MSNYGPQYNRAGHNNSGYTDHSQDSLGYQQQQGFNQSNNAYAPAQYRSNPQQPPSGNWGSQGNDAIEMRTFEHQSTDLGETAHDARQLISGQVKQSKAMMDQILELRKELVYKDMDNENAAQKKRSIDKAMAELQSYNEQLKLNIQRARGKFGEGTIIDTEMNNFRRNVQQHTEAENQLRGVLEGQLAQQWKIANNIDPQDPEGDKRAWEAVQSGEAVQAFQSAAMGNRRQGARNALSNAQARQQEIQKIAQQMEELSQLFNTMHEMVVEQEATVAGIEEKTAAGAADIENGVTQLDTGIEKAKSARRKKWWCLLIVVILIIIIVIVIMVVVVKPIIENSNKKRSLEYLAHARRSVLEGVPSRRSNIPPQAHPALLD